MLIWQSEAAEAANGGDRLAGRAPAQLATRAHFLVGSVSKDTG